MVLLESSYRMPRGAKGKSCASLVEGCPEKQIEIRSGIGKRDSEVHFAYCLSRGLARVISLWCRRG